MESAEHILDSIRARFNSKVDISADDNCHIWTAAKSGIEGRRYGVMKVKWPGDVSKREYAHRISFILANLNSFPTFNPKYNISHLCHNTLCVNIVHLSHEDSSNNRNRQTCLELGTCTANHKQDGQLLPDCILN
jgi:hypothetical protein